MAVAALEITAPGPRPRLAFGPRVRRSPFHDRVMAAGCTEATVYNHMILPLSYGDPEREYWQLIEGVTVWDVAAQRQVEIHGPDASVLAGLLTPRWLGRCEVGRCMYVPVCDHQGGMLNDPVLLRVEEDRYWLSLADGDLLLWVGALALERGLRVTVAEPDVSPLAIQGPLADEVARQLFGDWAPELRYFRCRPAELEGIPLVVARSGWSKQGGFELYLRDATLGNTLWDRVMEAGRPWGIIPGAPNGIERVESGLLSYRSDMDASTNPFEVGLGRFVDLEPAREFIGREALSAVAREGPRRSLVGLFIEDPPLSPNELPWLVRRSDDGRRAGRVTSAVRSPRLDRNIALALLEREALEARAPLVVETPWGARHAEVTGLPFVPPGPGARGPRPAVKLLPGEPQPDGRRTPGGEGFTPGDGGEPPGGAC